VVGRGSVEPDLDSIGRDTVRLAGGELNTAHDSSS
jgi:hypothetical protein